MIIGTVKALASWFKSCRKKPRILNRIHKTKNIFVRRAQKTKALLRQKSGFQRQLPSSFPRAISLLTLSSIMTAVKGSFCEGKRFYLTAAMNDNQTPGIYAVEVQRNFYSACDWVKDVLDSGSCNITKLEGAFGFITGYIDGSCQYTDDTVQPVWPDAPAFSGKSIILSAVNDTLLNITQNIQCILNSFDDECHRKSLMQKIDEYIDIILVILLMCCCGAALLKLLCMQVTECIENVKVKLYEYRARTIENELLSLNNGSFKHKNGPLLLIAEYANPEIIPPNLRSGYRNPVNFCRTAFEVETENESRGDRKKNLPSTKVKSHRFAEMETSIDLTPFLPKSRIG